MLPSLDRMYRYALALTRNEDDARDVVQEAYLRAYRYFGGFRRGANPRAWLYRILFNVHLARHGGRSVRAQPFPDREEATDSLLYDRLVRDGGWKDPIEADPGRFGGLLGDEVARALADLPAAFRIPLLLCDAEGFAYAEIARILRCPVNTVRSRIARGRGRMERRLGEYARRHGYLKGGRR